VSPLGLSLGDVLLGLMETGEEGWSDPGPALRLRMPDGRVESEPLLSGFVRLDRAGAPARPRVV
jgi:hypothetical protein